ncbi:ring-opening amidohydrolase [Egibacter rhizosphaerae]|uniref:cyanuric acid amidohydrolase n=1 Tax=Egibacter rhizosphaerae TaxID=1670831 RepID=UPI00197AAC48|nr:ring-opening amidohydrolase [Egibacter rhizosphaerae]
MAFEVRKVEIGSVNDASGLAALIDDGAFGADDVFGIIGKTEGNGGVNDFTRVLADMAFDQVLLERGTRGQSEIDQIPMVWSGGCDGVITPHATVFARVDDPNPRPEPRLTAGIAMSEVIQPEDIGRPAMVEKIAHGVRDAMKAAGITDPSEVHYVQTKTPLLTMETINDAKSRGQTVFSEDIHQSMDMSNGTTGLGIAVGLGEIDMPTAEQIGKDHSLYSSVASCSSGVELERGQIVVVGNAPGVGGRYRIGHSVMEDALDFDGIYRALRSAGLDLPDRPHPGDIDERFVNVFLKCEAAPDATLRGRRQIMLDDSDVHWHRHAKGAVGGVTAAAVGDPAVFVSVGALHQGPAGGGPVAAIVDVGD